MCDNTTLSEIMIRHAVIEYRYISEPMSSFEGFQAHLDRAVLFKRIDELKAELDEAEIEYKKQVKRGDQWMRQCAELEAKLRGKDTKIEMLRAALLGKESEDEG